MTDIWAGLDELSGSLADLYRDLHQHPELSLQEYRTAGLVADALRPLGFEVTEQVGGTGVVGLLRNGDGPVVMLRADFDALPVLEETGLPYASSTRARGRTAAPVPVMHACGHDMHAACLVGAATLLSRAPDTWSGTLLVVFQPAEELARGARGHGRRRPVHPVPRAGHRARPARRAVACRGDRPRERPRHGRLRHRQVVLYGRGGHGSRPEAAIDPVLMAANVVTRLQGIVAREVPPAETAVVTVGRLQAGTKENVIPGTAELGINVRSYTPAVRDLVRAAIERIVNAEATASAAPRPPDITWASGAPVLVSDPAATEATVAAFNGHFGDSG